MTHDRTNSSYVLGIIHTQCPATPVCTDGEVTAGLMAQEVEQDLVRRETVTLRAKVIRKLVQNAGVSLNIAYAAEGKGSRSKVRRSSLEISRCNYNVLSFRINLKLMKSC